MRFKPQNLQNKPKNSFQTRGARPVCRTWMAYAVCPLIILKCCNCGILCKFFCDQDSIHIGT